ncbi:F1F0-ATPase inhibitor protein [Perilla frutescens var. frutescens]|nr:F1F0-ATPase inhibitor protein [Perilla frutescens var. frutescens]
MAMRSVVWRGGLCGLVECSLRSSAYSLRYLSDDRGRIFSEEERAKETVFIKKMEKERLEKQKKMAELEKAVKEKSVKPEGDNNKS